MGDKSVAVVDGSFTIQSVDGCSSYLYIPRGNYYLPHLSSKNMEWLDMAAKNSFTNCGETECFAAEWNEITISTCYRL